MANVFLSIPVPAADGAGAAVDVSTMGRTKTFVIGGGFRATVNVEYAVDAMGTIWAPIGTFHQSGNLTIDVACLWLRAVTSDYVSGAPNLDVGADDAGATAAALLSDGAAVDISTLARFKTVIVPYGFTGTVDLSEDGVVWAQIFGFSAQQPNAQSREVFGQYARCRGTVNGVAAGCSIAGADNDSGGGGGGANACDINIQDYGAVGNGIHDDTEAVQNAVDAALASGKDLLVPSATDAYKLTSVVTVAATEGFRMKGCGARAKFVYPSATNVNAFLFSAGSNKVTVDNIWFEGDHNDDKDVNSGVAIYMDQAATDLDVIGCRFDYCRPHQASANYSTAGRFQFLTCRVFNAPLPISPSGHTLIKGCWFVNDEVVATRCQAVYIFGANEACDIEGCVFIKIAEEAIQWRAGSSRFDQKYGLSVRGCYFESIPQYAIWVGSDDTTNVGAAVITDNRFRNVNGPIQSQGCRMPIIESNNIWWDWEYPFTITPGSGFGINASAGGLFAGQLGQSTSVSIKNNTLTHRHPFWGKLTINALPAPGETITVGAIVYLFVAGAPAAPYEIQIAGDTGGQVENIQAALQGRDSVSSPMNPALRDPSDAFSNQYIQNDAPINEQIIAGKSTFALSTTSAGIAVTAVIDARYAATYGINVDRSQWPSVSGNVITDFTNAIAMQHSYWPVVDNNTINNGAPILGIGNTWSTYSNNHFLAIQQANGFRPFRQLMLQDGFPLCYNNGLVTPNEYTTLELMGAYGTVTVGNGRARTFMCYGKEYFTDEASNTLNWRWNDSNTVQLRGQGMTALDLTFKRTAPGPTEFNSATDLIAKINATGDWSAAFAAYTDVGGTPNPEMMIEVSVTAPGEPPNLADPPRLYVTTASLICGQIMKDDSKDYAELLGGCNGVVAGLGATKTAIFSRIISQTLPPTVRTVRADNTVTELNPTVYGDDLIYGYAAEVTHDATVDATVQFAFAVPNQ
jgi:parallel beta-helix repeat protein